MKTGLVLEGGGMRDLYTVGVLDCFMERRFYLDYTVGVSAGAANMVSYLSGQEGRGVRVNLDYLGDKRYLSMSNFLRGKSLFGLDFIFDEIPNRLDPFDYQALQRAPSVPEVGVFDVNTGETDYFGAEHLVNSCDVLKASSSLPVFSPIMRYQGKEYLDGGTAAPIPFERALERGCEKLVVVLTRPRGYRKRPQRGALVYRRKYRAYPKLVHALDTRHEVYNRALDALSRLERQGKAVVLAPSRVVKMGRFEKDPGILRELYELGREDARRLFDEHILPDCFTAV